MQNGENWKCILKIIFCHFEVFLFIYTLVLYCTVFCLLDFSYWYFIEVLFHT